MDQPQQEKNQPQIVQMMTTEHYNLQSGRSLAISDANGRAGLFLGTVSSTLVALAFIRNISHVGTQLGTANRSAWMARRRRSFARPLENTDSCLNSHRLQTVPLSLKKRHAFIRKHTILAGAL
jgi:hypothetical protein